MKLKQVFLIVAISAASDVGSVVVYNKYFDSKTVSVGSAEKGLPVNYAGFFDGKTGTPAEGMDFTKAANAAVPAVVHIKTKIPAKKVIRFAAVASISEGNGTQPSSWEQLVPRHKRAGLKEKTGGLSVD